MAVEQNLIQVQSQLQDPSVTNDNLIKYANGSNPEVPSFLALIEMNRRKQIETAGAQFNQSSKDSIKNQVASALTQPQAGTNMGANPFTKNLTTAAPGVNMSGNPATADITKGIAGINPAAMPAQPSTAPMQPITGAADGGLMSLPVDHFNEQSYAGGGIIAFGDPKLNPNENQVVPTPNAEYQGILASLPKVEAPVEKTQEQLYADKLARDKLAGVAADPYSDVKARELQRESRQQANYDKQGMDRLMAQLTAFGSADPARGFGYAAGESAKASQSLEKEQNALRDKEESAQIEFQRGIAKEEDARRRGDSDGIKSALDAQQKAKLEVAKAQNETATLAAHIYNYGNTAKYQNGMLGYYDRMADISEASKPTADDKKIQKADALTNQDPQYKIEASRLSSKDGAEPGSPEYNATIQRMYEIQKRHYVAQGLTPPPAPVLPEPVAAPAAKPGILDRMFGSNKPAANTMQPGWTVKQNP